MLGEQVLVVKLLPKSVPSTCRGVSQDLSLFIRPSLTSHTIVALSFTRFSIGLLNALPYW